MSCKYKQFAVECILNSNLECLKEVRTMDMILGKCKFPNSFIFIFSNICCMHTLELPLCCTYNICLFNILVFDHTLF